MKNITLLLAEKMVKAIAAFLLGEENLVNADDLASLCRVFFDGKDSVSELRMNTSLQQAQLELYKGMETILSKGNLTEQQQSLLKERIISSIDRTDLSSAHLAHMHNDPNRLYRELVENCEDIENLSQDEEDYVKRCLRFVASGIISVVSAYALDFSAMNYMQILQEIDNLKDYLSQNMSVIIESLQSKENPDSDFNSEYMLAIK